MAESRTARLIEGRTLYSAGTYRGARRLVEVCGAVRAGEVVAVVTDTTNVHLAGVVAGEAASAGGEPTLFVMPPRTIDGEEPTAVVARAMEHADLSIQLTRASLAHSTAVRLALAAGTRVMSIPACTERLLATGGLYADFHGLRPVCRAVTEILTAGSVVYVRAPGGTDVTMSIVGRDGNAHDCIADSRGRFASVPNIEANIAPVEGTAEGTIVFDASIPNLGIGVLDEPVRLEVKRGRVVEVSGGRQARKLDLAWRERKNDLVYVIAQLAIGLNPQCREITGQLTNDHGVLGTMHFGIGTSKNLGGETEASMHIDGILWSPTIVVDGETIMRDGEPIGAWGAGLRASVA